MAETITEAAEVIERLSSRLQSRRDDISKRLRYLRGTEGNLRFASDEFKTYAESQYKGFFDNWCLPVAQATAERMNPLGVRLNDNSAEIDSDLQRVWIANGCDRGFSEAALVMSAASRAFVLVSPTDDPRNPRITWEHPEQAIVEHDPATGERLYGMIVWTDTEWDHATLWGNNGLMWKMKRPTQKPAGVDKWENTPLNGWVQREVPGEDFPARNPLGSEEPLIELSNNSLLTDEPMSDIDPVMDMQDVLNLVWAYLMNGLDYASLPQRVALGAEPPTVPIFDGDGEEIGERAIELDKLIRERIMFLTGENVSISEWSPANLDVFSNVIEHAVQHIAAQTRTPPHYLIAKMVNTSAESLTISEAGLVSKVQERITYITPALREMYRLVALAMDMPDKAEAVLTAHIAFRDVQYRSDAQKADALQKRKALGYPLEYLLELDGVPPYDIPRVLAMREKELAQDPMAAFAADMANTGTPVTEGPTDDVGP